MKRFHEPIQDEAGNIVVGAEIYVRLQSDSSLATLYSDDGSTTTANPVTSGSDGYATFYAANNVYKLQIYVDGTLETTIEHYQHFDLSGLTDAGADRIAFWDESANDLAWLALDTGLSISGTTLSLDGELVALAGLTSAADKVPYFTGSGTAAVADFTAAGRALMDDANAAAQRTTLGLGTIATFDETTAAQYRANTADKALSTDTVWAAADYVALTDAATVAMDMSAGFNFSLTIGGNRTLDAPTNTKNGQTGAIVITQDGTGSRTLAYHANWKFAGGADPTLSTAAGAVDILFYQVISSTSIYGTLVKAIA